MTNDMAIEILWTLGILISLIAAVWIALAPREMSKTGDAAQSNQST